MTVCRYSRKVCVWLQSARVCSYSILVCRYGIFMRVWRYSLNIFVSFRAYVVTFLKMISLHMSVTRLVELSHAEYIGWEVDYML